jgi:hypothetical protein
MYRTVLCLAIFAATGACSAESPAPDPTAPADAAAREDAAEDGGRPTQPVADAASDALPKGCPPCEAHYVCEVRSAYPGTTQFDPVRLPTGACEFSKLTLECDGTVTQLEKGRGFGTWSARGAHDVDIVTPSVQASLLCDARAK